MASKSDSTPADAPVAVLEYEHSPMEELILKHRRKLILVAVLALVVSAAYLGMKLMKEHKISQANQSFTRANTLPDLRKTAESFEGTPAGGSAMIETARLLEQEGRPGEAIDTLRKYFTKYGAADAHTLQEFAKFRLADLLADNGQAAEAEKLYKELLTSQAFAPRAKLRLADQLMATDKKDEAAKYYEEISKLKGSAELSEHAKKRLEVAKLARPAMIPYVEEKPATPPDAPLPVVPIPSVPGVPPATADNPFGNVDLNNPGGASTPDSGTSLIDTTQPGPPVSITPSDAAPGTATPNPSAPAPDPAAPAPADGGATTPPSGPESPVAPAPPAPAEGAKKDQP